MNPWVLPNFFRFSSRGVWPFAVIAVMLSFCLSSCTRQTDGPRENQKIQTATRMLGDGQYDSAIQLLEDVRSDDPTSVRALTILASAYAARAGVNVQDFWGFAVGYEKLFGPHAADPSPLGAALEQKPASSNAAWQIQNILKGVTINVAALTDILQRVQQIPYLEPSKRQDVQTAVDIMAQVDTQGGHLYRAILNIILIRSSVQDAGSAVQSWTQKKYALCSPEFALLSQTLIGAYDSINQVFSDLKLAYPSKSEDLSKYQNELAQVSTVIETLKSMDPREAARLCALKK